jgi:hypothetical protein
VDFQRHGVDLRKCDDKCVLDFQTIQINDLRGVVIFVHLIERKPRDVELNLVLHVFQIIIVHDLLLVSLLL